MDQHLFAEWREIKMVAPALMRSLANHSPQHVLSRIPKEFTLNKGHVMFFYDKQTYLIKRYELLTDELRRRGVMFNPDAQIPRPPVLPVFYQDYTPTPEALDIIRERIRQKIAMKPHWYRYTE